MKAGILTFHEADNYGAVLQAYALQTVLARLGAESEFVAFLKAAPGQEAGGTRTTAFAEKLREEQKKRAALFEQFRKKRLVCAEPVPQEQAGELDGRYDVFIAGSDQVWNFQIPGADSRYFLPFADRGKRVAYAASFGADGVPDGRRDWYARQLREFRAISVREKRGRELVRELTGRDCAVCLDPVLLLEQQDWEALSAVGEKEPYIFLHMVQFDQALLERAEALAGEKGLELRVTTAGYVPRCGYSAWNGVGVEEWVGLLQNAEYVFTNSFHATAFSLLFERPVWAAALTERLSGRSGRIAELLEYAGITADSPEGAPAAVPEAFGVRLSELRRASVEYLRHEVILNGSMGM